MLTPQHQQQLMLAQQNLASPSASDDNRRLRMLLNNRNIGVTKDGLSNPVGDIVSNVGSPLQAGGPAFPRSDTDMLMKVVVLFQFIFSSSYGSYIVFSSVLFIIPWSCHKCHELHLLNVFVCVVETGAITTSATAECQSTTAATATAYSFESAISDFKS